MAGLALVVTVAEGYLRLTVPFMTSRAPEAFDPQLGNRFLPNAEVQATNQLEFWTMSRANSYGFLDREPQPAPNECHIAMIGDSFVEAREVPILEKFHVRLETLAARQLPELAVATSAFAKSGTGQIAQLPYYDVARRLAPDVVVLVFVANDFADNHPLLKAMSVGLDPEGMPWVTAARSADGTIRLRPPVSTRSLSRPPPDDAWHKRVLGVLRGNATLNKLYFKAWLRTRVGLFTDYFRYHHAWTEQLRQLRDYEPLLRGWHLTAGSSPDQEIRKLLGQNAQVPVVDEALAFTAFALDRFKAQSERDGAALVAFATHTMRTDGDPLFDRFERMAAQRGIPVVSLYDFVVRNGGKIEDLIYPHDRHWTADGHRWAARALLEYLHREPGICSRAEPSRRALGPS